MEFTQIKDFFIVLLAVLGFLSAGGGVVNLFSKWIKDSKVTKHETMLADHESRINKLENATKSHDDFTRILCNSILALLSNELNENGKEELKKAKKELENYLVEK